MQRSPHGDQFEAIPPQGIAIYFCFLAISEWAINDVGPLGGDGRGCSPRSTFLVDKHYAQNGSGVEDLNAHRRSFAPQKFSRYVDESKLIFALVAFLFVQQRGFEDLVSLRAKVLSRPWRL